MDQSCWDSPDPFQMSFANSLKRLAAQPAEKTAFEQLGVKPIDLGAPVFARHRHTRCVNDVGLNVVCIEPARQPEAVTASLESDSDAFYPVSCLLRFLSPSMQQLQQCALVDPELFRDQHRHLSTLMRGHFAYYGVAATVDDCVGSLPKLLGYGGNGSLGVIVNTCSVGHASTRC
jgi:hypothetical protein